MYQFPYAEVLDETPQGARERERQAIDRSIELLAGGRQGRPQSREAIEALLSCAGCGASWSRTWPSPRTICREQLRADLISIGLWIMREAEQIRLEKSDQLQGHHRGVDAPSATACSEADARASEAQETANPWQISTSSPTPARPTTQPTAAAPAPAASVDYNAFLQLLIAQMKNQDPTKPMDSAQLMSQLASFSNVEQGIKINRSSTR